MVVDPGRGKSVGKRKEKKKRKKRMAGGGGEGENGLFRLVSGPLGGGGSAEACHSLRALLPCLVYTFYMYIYMCVW